MGSSLFSEYDDLRDFDGRFGSQSTLEARSLNQKGRRKPSKGILGRLKPSKPTPQPLPATETLPQTAIGKKLKTLRSMGSLKGKSSSTGGSKKDKTDEASPQLPQPTVVDVGLGLGDFDWNKSSAAGTPSSEMCSSLVQAAPMKLSRSADAAAEKASLQSLPRQIGRRSISFSASSAKAARAGPASLPCSPHTSSFPPPYSHVIATASSSYQAALGNALIAASHAEASKGTHSDLLQILNHDNRPWGFSYVEYPHGVQVWYGDRDEKIAENAVRWMERVMGEDRCRVRVVKGADHALMYKSSVVVEVLECVREFW